MMNNPPSDCEVPTPEKDVFVNNQCGKKKNAKENSCSLGSADYNQTFNLSSQHGQDHLKDLNQQLSALNAQGGDSFLFGSDNLVIDEFKTPKKSTPKKFTPKKSVQKGRTPKKENSKKISAKSKSKLQIESLNQAKSSEPDTSASTSLTKSLPNVKSKPKEKNNDIDNIEWDAEIDSIISSSARRSNLSSQNVKQILKYIVTNEHVLDMVKNTMEGNSSSSAAYEPKLTRSKTKELIEKNKKLPWPISPIKSVQSSEKKIIEADFQEDESDEEYNPLNEDVESDDESMASSHLSDLGSPQAIDSPYFHSPTKTPTRAILDTENETADSLQTLISESDLIASRTRSKLPLTETPLETIESQFFAPDITTDMYNTECHDEEWKQFLNEFIQPLDAIVNSEADEEDNDDPTYNFMEDENKEDEWETRDDKGVKITKNELSELMEDLFQGHELDLLEEIIEANSPAANFVPACETPQEMTAPSSDDMQQSNPSLFPSELIDQLLMQLNQHIQLLSQVHLLSIEAKKSDITDESKALLTELHVIAQLRIGKPSVFLCSNIFAAADLMNAAEREAFFPPVKMPKMKFGRQITKISDTILDIFFRHKDSLFSDLDLLPTSSLMSVHNAKQKCLFTIAEDGLFAIGLEEYKRRFSEICTYLMPTKTPAQLRNHFKNVRAPLSPYSEENPLKYYAVHEKLKDFSYLVLAKEPNRTKHIIVHKIKSVHQKEIKPKPQLKKTAIVKPNIEKRLPPVIKVSPLKQVSPILKKYNLINKQKSYHRITPYKPILPNIPAKILLNANDRSPKPTARRKLLPKLEGQDNVVPAKDASIAEIKVQKKTVTTNKVINELPATKSTVAPLSLEKVSVPTESSTEAVPSHIDSESQSDSEDFVEDDSADKEVDLVALMTASSRICSKRAKGLKRTKQQREVESSLVLLESSNYDLGLQNEDKANVFAQSYLNRVFETLSQNQELDSYEKFVKLLHDFGTDETISTIMLFQNVGELLSRHENLVDEFIGFLLPEEALECGVITEYLHISKMKEFLRKLEVHFGKNPQYLQKILRVLTQFQLQTDFTSSDLKAAVVPLLRGQNHLIDEFLSLIPDIQPPESLMTDFEEVNFSDQEKDSDEDFESVTIPETQDKYGSKECPCVCHANTQNARYVNRIAHCAACGTKFIDGRVYLQIGKMLKPAKIIYHNSVINSTQTKHQVNHAQNVEKKMAENSFKFGSESKSLPNTKPKTILGVQNEASSVLCSASVPAKDTKRGKSNVTNKSDMNKTVNGPVSVELCFQPMMLSPPIDKVRRNPPNLSVSDNCLGGRRCPRDFSRLFKTSDSSELTCDSKVRKAKSVIPVSSTIVISTQPISRDSTSKRSNSNVLNKNDSKRTGTPLSIDVCDTSSQSAMLSPPTQIQHTSHSNKEKLVFPGGKPAKDFSRLFKSVDSSEQIDDPKIVKAKNVIASTVEGPQCSRTTKRKFELITKSPQMRPLELCDRSTEDDIPFKNANAAGGDKVLLNIKRKSVLSISSESGESAKKSNLAQEILVTDGNGSTSTSSSSCVWSKENDRTLLLKCKELGATAETFSVISEMVMNKTPEQVKSRFQALMKLLSAENSSPEESSDNSDIS